uniref:Phosphoprotein n=5 Tax=Human respiratory syncytial virus TaxID=11250 RepID=A0A8F5ZA72_HRSV|nr:P-BFP [Human orthopneumovirus]QXO84956.1 P-BFP [Human orthopneumovirus]
MEKFAPEFHGEDANNRATKFLESIKGKFTSPKDPKKKDSIISVNSIDIEVTKESPITSNSTIINPTNETDDTAGTGMSELIKENMHMKLYMEGTVDNHHFKCTSEGEGKPYEGTQTMRIKVVEGGPLPFAFDILATSFLYGSKTFINHTQGIPDFFKQSFPEGFTWERVTTYEDGGVLTATQDTSLQDGCLIYNVKIRGVNFTSNGPVMQKKTLGWEAFTETLYPADGGLEGRNDMALKLVGGSHLIANIKTTYRSKKPAKNLKMPGVYYVDYRLERIKEANNETYVEQHEVAVARYCDLPSKLGHKLNSGLRSRTGNKPNYQRKPLVSFKEDPTPSDNPFSKLYKETIETFDNNEEESSYSYEEINDQTNDNITARLDRIDEKLSEILGMLHTLVVASAGPTSARDGIRDAMVGLREEMIEKIRTEALMTNDRLEAMARLRNEESEKMAKDTSDEVSLNPTSEKLNNLLEGNDSDNDLSLEDF